MQPMNPTKFIATASTLLFHLAHSLRGTPQLRLQAFHQGAFAYAVYSGGVHTSVGRTMP